MPDPEETMSEFQKWVCDVGKEVMYVRVLPGIPPQATEHPCRVHDCAYTYDGIEMRPTR